MLTPNDYLAVVRQRLPTIVVTCLLITAAVVGLTATQEPRWRAGAQVLVSRENPVQEFSRTREPSPPTQRRFISTQAQLARAPLIADRTVRAQRLPPARSGQLRAATTVGPMGPTNVLLVRIEQRTPADAVRLVNEYARQVVAYRRELNIAQVDAATRRVEAALEGLDEQTPGDATAMRSTLRNELVLLRTLRGALGGDARVIAEARRAVKVHPNLRRAAALSLGIGLILGIVAAFVHHALDGRARSPEEVGRRLGLPVIGRLPPPGDGGPSQPFADAAWRLRLDVELANVDVGARIIATVAGEADEGRSTALLALAGELARADHRVVLVDLDLRRPALAARLGVDDRPGAVDLALGRAEPGDVLRRIVLDRDAGSGDLSLVPSGHAEGDAHRVITPRRLREMFSRLTAQADLVLVDSPAGDRSADATSIAAAADALLVVVHLRRARLSRLDALRATVESLGVPVLGVVVTGVRPDVSLPTFAVRGPGRRTTAEAGSPRSDGERYP